MGVLVDPEALLVGPRGRRFCSALLDVSAWTWGKLTSEAGGTGRFAAELANAVCRVDLNAIARHSDPAAFWDALLESVYAARYWQEADDRDLRLEAIEISAILRPVAEAISCAPATQWWNAPVAVDTQCEVSFDDPLHPRTSEPMIDPNRALAVWRAKTVAYELQAKERPDDPRAPYAGAWWSTPADGSLVDTTQSLGRGGPVGLSLVEDSWGPSSAECRALVPQPGASIFEIDGPDHWIELVRRYPLAVPLSRRHDWWRVTGQDLRWAIPDYVAVAGDYDGVHLSVIGYLSTAGRALDAGAFQTVLAGWNPDQT